MSLIPQILLSINLPSRRSVGENAWQVRKGLRNHLLQELKNYNLIATWIVHDRHLQEARELARMTAASQEISLYLETATKKDQRTALSEQLTNVTKRSRDLSLRMTTLSTDQKIDEENLNLLVRNKISMVNRHCGIQKTSGALKSLEPSSLRFGIWETPAPLQWAKQLSNPVRELILKSTMHFKSKRPFQHIQIDVQSMLHNTRAANKVTGLLQTLSRMRERGKIDVTPIRSAAKVLRQLHFSQLTKIPAA